jgi:hypothetical protein
LILHSFTRTRKAKKSRKKCAAGEDSWFHSLCFFFGNLAIYLAGACCFLARRLNPPPPAEKKGGKSKLEK